MIYTTQRRRFVYDTWDNGSRLDRVKVEWTLSITHCLRLNLQLHTIDLVRTCRISSFCTVAWQLARFQLTRRIARSVGDSWASCTFLVPAHLGSPGKGQLNGCVCVHGETDWTSSSSHGNMYAFNQNNCYSVVTVFISTSDYMTEEYNIAAIIVQGCNY